MRRTGRTASARRAVVLAWTLIFFGAVEASGVEVWTGAGEDKIMNRFAFDGTFLGSFSAPANGQRYVDAIFVVPEPATLSLLALGGLAILRWRSR